MLKITLFSLLLVSNFCFGQLTEQFNDGNFTNNPVWQGDETRFIINANDQLQSGGANSANQTLYLSTPSSSSLNTKWEFSVQLNFDPTTSNYTRIYLSSDQADLAGNLNGYFIQIGETGPTDGINLYRQTGNSTLKIFSGPPKTRTNANLFNARIKVTRDNRGEWQVFSDASGGNDFTFEGSTIDNLFTTSAFLGVFCKYATASRYNQFVFDDFFIDDLTPDITPPELVSVEVIDSLNLRIVFSESIDSLSALQTANYNLNSQSGNPTSGYSTNNPAAYILRFATTLASGPYVLSVKNIKDVRGNQIANDASKSFFYLRSYNVKVGDIVINEIFANPTNSPGLPAKEFVELWNTSKEYLLTAGWKYSDLTSTFTFKTDTIAPREYVILCTRADTSSFQTFGKTIGLSPWPSLNNSGDVLTLVNRAGDLIDKVSYSDSWYKDDIKKKGGHSLELVDPKNLCTGIQNWAASLEASGGTPGKQNSIYRAQMSSEIPKLLSAFVLDSLTVEISFSKSVDSASGSKIVNYQINNGVGNPLDIKFSSAMFDKATLIFKNALVRGMENILTLNNITDCARNLIDPNANSVKLFIAKAILPNDLLISEVLFNPKSNGVDFVEIYNNTSQVLDLKELQLGTVDGEGKLSNIKKVSIQPILIQPEKYWVLTSIRENILQNYIVENPNNFAELTSLPSFSNDKGTVVLLSNGKIIDRFDYTEKMHNPLLKNADGVSLERISFIERTNANGNFTSAAGSVGFATPSYKNSNSKSGEDVYVNLLSKTFSPDGDGFEDLLEITYQFADGEKFATINLYSDRGVLIRRLLKNQTIATKGNLNWDGMTDGGLKAPVGIYILLFDVFDLKGKTKRFKKTCILAAKLN